MGWTLEIHGPRTRRISDAGFCPVDTGFKRAYGASSGPFTDHSGRYYRPWRFGDNRVLYASRPIEEPVAAHGPFVMNRMQQVQQACAGYHAGRLTVRVPAAHILLNGS
jgi:Pirin C-terminal cupin domain